MTLYHWDLPQELEDAGGWPARDTAYRFADYAMMVFDRLQDRVDTWTTLNEPWCSGMLGYAYGAHAPGRRDFEAGIHAVHHLLLGHGLATERMRAAATHAQGLRHHAEPRHGHPVHRQPSSTARRPGGPTGWACACTWTRWSTAATRRTWSQDLAAARRRPSRSHEGDLEHISVPFEVLGVNFYSGSVFSGVDEDGNTRGRARPAGRPGRARGRCRSPRWVGRSCRRSSPSCCVRLSRDYPGRPIVITENGAAFDDQPDETGFVQDEDRVAVPGRARPRPSPGPARRAPTCAATSPGP